MARLLAERNKVFMHRRTLNFHISERHQCGYLCDRMRVRCGASCTSGSSAMADDSIYGSGCGNAPSTGVSGSIITSPPTNSGFPPTSGPTQNNAPDGSHQTLTTRGSVISTSSSASKPSSAFVSLAGLIGETGNKEPVTQRVQVCSLLIKF